MTRTFCDKCGAECVSSTTSVAVRTVHRSGGQYVAEDEHRPVDLCFGCGTELITEYGIKVMPHDYDEPRELPVRAVSS
jgi:hypothetical protein